MREPSISISSSSEPNETEAVIPITDRDDLDDGRETDGSTSMEGEQRSGHESKFLSESNETSDGAGTIFNWSSEGQSGITNDVSGSSSSSIVERS